MKTSGRIISRPEEIDYVLWDRVLLTEDTILFSHPLGETAEVKRDGFIIANKNYSETNLTTSGCEPFRSVNVIGIKINIISEKFDEQEYIKLINDCVLDFKIIDKRILVVPFNITNIKHAVVEVDESESVNTIIKNLNFKFTVPIYITPCMCFQIRVLHNSLKYDQKYAIQIALVGICRRPT